MTVNTSAPELLGVHFSGLSPQGISEHLDSELPPQTWLSMNPQIRVMFIPSLPMESPLFLALSLRGGTWVSSSRICCLLLSSSSSWIFETPPDLLNQYLSMRAILASTLMVAVDGNPT